MKNSILYYSVGALLYCPANNDSIGDAILNNKFGNKFSLALCLEDTIHDDYVTEAEEKMCHSLRNIYQAIEKINFYLPKIFIRVRNPEQIIRLSQKLGSIRDIVTGFIIPKFSIDNADLYIENLCKLNTSASHPLYMMPIYESFSLIDLRTRYDILYHLKEKLDSMKEHILNIRVGGNDLCHVFGFRRHSNESIHKIGPISQIFCDINTVYALDYVVSGPVWEYFNGNHWESGLIQEIQDDKLCGFIGKTVIHPKQISIVNNAYAVSKSDYESACSILNWNKTNHSLVSSDPYKERMNEYKTHTNWAKKTLFLAEYYGIQEEKSL